MTVQELIDLLKQEPLHEEVFISVSSSPFSIKGLERCRSPIKELMIEPNTLLIEDFFVTRGKL